VVVQRCVSLRWCIRGILAANKSGKLFLLLPHVNRISNIGSGKVALSNFAGS
jgi:hypothetical protein